MKTKKRLNPLLFVLLIPAAAILGTIILLIARGDGFGGNAENFPDAIFADNPAALRGNTYTLRCVIDRQLAQNENGRVLAVKLLDKEGRVAVFVRSTILQNFEVGQRYNMQVRVKENMLYVESLKKF